MKNLVRFLLLGVMVIGSIYRVSAKNLVTDDFDYDYEEELVDDEDRYTGPGVNLSNDGLVTYFVDTDTSLLYVNDGGPGMGVKYNTSETSMVYDNVGPGVSIPKDTYVFAGPIAVESKVTPEDYYKILNIMPTSGERAYRYANKTTTNLRKSK